MAEIRCPHCQAANRPAGFYVSRSRLYLPSSGKMTQNIVRCWSCRQEWEVREVREETPQEDRP